MNSAMDLITRCFCSKSTIDQDYSQTVYLQHFCILSSVFRLPTFDFQLPTSSLTSRNLPDHAPENKTMKG